MNTPAGLALPLLLAAVLVASGLGKLRSDEDGLQAFRALGVPRALRKAAVVRAHPWVELVLAAALVLLPRPFSVVAAIAALGLMLVYTLLVGRALSAPDPVDCHCFGVLGDGSVTRVTLARNVWLTLLAAAAVAATASEPASVVGRLLDAGATTWTWLAVVAVATGTAVLVVAGGHEREAAETPAGDASGDALGGDQEELDYLRVITPAIPVTSGDGTTVTLRDLAEHRAQLVLHVSSLCGACEDTLASVPAWRAAMPELDVRILTLDPPESSRLTSVEEPQSLHDPHQWVGTSLGMSGTPSAVLLGMDGMLAGGPVTGVLAIEEFVEEILEQLRESAAAAAEHPEAAGPEGPAPAESGVSV